MITLLGDGKTTAMAERRAAVTASRKNVNDVERALSVAAGAVLGGWGLQRRDTPGLLGAALGAALLYRGFTGQCPAYSALHLDTRTTTEHIRDTGLGHLHVEQSYLIHQPPQRLYQFWRNLENLPQIMSHLQSVEVLDDCRSRWTVSAPSVAGGSMHWDAQITIDEPGTRIAWRSLPGAEVDNSGAVRFMAAPGQRGTIVQVALDYSPPAGRVGKWIATLFGEDAAQQIREDLRHFKRVMECGEVLTTQGQPRGTCPKIHRQGTQR